MNRNHLAHRLFHRPAEDRGTVIVCAHVQVVYDGVNITSPSTCAQPRFSQLREQHNLDLRHRLDERDEDLAAARATNRELMARLNAPGPRR